MVNSPEHVEFQCDYFHKDYFHGVLDSVYSERYETNRTLTWVAHIFDVTYSYGRLFVVESGQPVRS